MDVTLRALNRFGLGARRGERQRIKDGRNWLRGQLDSGAPSLAPPSGVTPAAIGDALRGVRMPGQGDEQQRREARRRVVEIGQLGSPCGVDRAGHERSAVRRAARRVLVQSSVRLDRSEDSRRAARRQLRARRDSGRTCWAASRTWCWRRRSIRRCSPTSITSSRSVPPRAARARVSAAAATASGAASTRTTRASCWSCTRSASTAATRSRTCRSWRRS